MTSTETETDRLTTVQVYRVYIRATPERVWEAITSPSGPSATATAAASTTTCGPAASSRPWPAPELKRFGAPDA